MQEKLTPEQAFINITNACYDFKGTKKDHVILEHSMNLIHSLSFPNREEPEQILKPENKPMEIVKAQDAKAH